MGLKMATSRQEEGQQHATQPECGHYWIIESAVDRVSKGLCKLCGAQKEFNNYLPDCLGESSKEYQELLGGQRAR